MYKSKIRKNKVTNVILCGGNGTRLWPVSRSNLPKQFLQMFDNESLFQKICKINQQYCDKFLFIANAEQYFIASDQYSEIKNNISFTDTLSIIEPVGRNTAAAIAFAAMASDEDEILFVTPSDHLITQSEHYKDMLTRAQELAQEGYIVTFGITPKSPETGFGYIEAQGEDVKLFHEKPNKEQAIKYLKNNNFLWNSGMFCFKAKIYLQELQKYAPEIYKTASTAFFNIQKKENTLRIITSYMLKIPEESIDYAILEKSNLVKVVKTDIAWNDIGSFDSLEHIFKKDDNGNSTLQNLVSLESYNNFVFGNYKTIALNHIENLIIVETPTALLISQKGESQSIKQLVELVKEKDPALVKFGRTVFRPWGKFTNLEQGKRFKVKSLYVNPGKRLSLQKHLYRSEHWTVVQGNALVQLDEQEFLLAPNESTYIPIGTKHRLSNYGKFPLEIIEVQVGEYLEEDDIIRYEDDYERLS